MIWMASILVVCTLGEVRTWTDRTGQHKTEAELVTVEGGVAHLKKTDGTVVKVPVEKLSEADQEHLRRYVPKPAKRAIIGVVVMPMKEALPLLAEYKLPRPKLREGMFVDRVLRQGPAEKAGIKFADVLCKAGSQRFSTTAAFDEWSRNLIAGTSYTLGILRLEDSPQKNKKGVWKASTVVVVAELEEAVKKRDAQACPLELLEAKIGVNAIGEPTVSLKARNASEKAVVAYSVSIYCFNRFDDPIGGLAGKSNRFGGISQHTIEPKETQSTKGYWTLHFRDTTAKARIVMDRVRFADGSEWTPAKDQAVAIEAHSPK